MTLVMAHVSVFNGKPAVREEVVLFARLEVTYQDVAQVPAGVTSITVVP